MAQTIKEPVLSGLLACDAIGFKEVIQAMGQPLATDIDPFVSGLVASLATVVGFGTVVHVMMMVVMMAPMR